MGEVNYQINFPLIRLIHYFRSTQEAPAEHIVATIAAIVLFLSVPFIIPLAHRLSRKGLRTTLQGLAILSICAILLFASGLVRPFNELHPRRLFLLHSEDVRICLNISVRSRRTERFSIDQHW